MLKSERSLRKYKGDKGEIIWVHRESLIPTQKLIETTRVNIASICEDMLNVGFLSDYPLEVFIEDGNYYIGNGHHRYLGATLAGIEWIPVIPLSFEPFSFNSVTELLERHDITTYEVQLWDDFVALLKQLPKHVSGINVRAYIDNYNQFSINIPNASLE